MPKSRQARDRQSSEAPRTASRCKRLFIRLACIAVPALLLGGAWLLIQHLPDAIWADWRTVPAKQSLTAALAIILAPPQRLSSSE